MTSPIQVTEDGTEEEKTQDHASVPPGPQKDEINPGLWKLLIAAGGILVVVFVTMELVQDTYLSPTQSTLDVTVQHGHS